MKRLKKHAAKRLLRQLSRMNFEQNHYTCVPYRDPSNSWGYPLSENVVQKQRRPVNEALASGDYLLALRFTKGKGWFPAIVDKQAGRNAYQLNLGRNYPSAAAILSTLFDESKDNDWTLEQNLPKLFPFF